MILLVTRDDLKPKSRDKSPKRICIEDFKDAVLKVAQSSDEIEFLRFQDAYQEHYNDYYDRDIYPEKTNE